MDLAELQSAFDQLTADHAAIITEKAALQSSFDALTAEKADLQLRFDATAGFILNLQAQHAAELKAEKDAHAVTAAARDTFKQGFDTQTLAHRAAVNRFERLRLGLRVSGDPLPAAEPSPAPSTPAPADGSAPTA